MEWPHRSSTGSRRWVLLLAMQLMIVRALTNSLQARAFQQRLTRLQCWPCRGVGALLEPEASTGWCCVGRVNGVAAIHVCHTLSAAFMCKALKQCSSSHVQGQLGAEALINASDQEGDQRMMCCIRCALFALTCRCSPSPLGRPCSMPSRRA